MSMRMQQIKNILLKLFAVITVLAFILTTSGFTLHKHTCSHHEAQLSISQIDDCCVADEVKVEVDCCKVVAQCSNNEDEADCCESDQSYHKLSNWYVQSYQQEVNLDCNQQIIIKIDQQVIETKENYQKTPDFNTHKKKPDRRKYRLFHQVKLDPPLI
jgi:hypothetical protein